MKFKEMLEVVKRFKNNERSYQKSLRLLKEGIHTTSKGDKIEISKMSDEHLMNSVAYAYQRLDFEYWNQASVLFKEEALRRIKNTKVA